MLKNIQNNVLIPLLSRAGTFIATLLAGYGVQAEPAQQIGVGIAAALAVAADLIVDRWVRVDVARKSAGR